MQVEQVKEQYVAPTLEKCRQLKDVTEGAATGSTTGGGSAGGGVNGIG